ncbi:hypothetical protein [Amycolatopsis sp. CA-230715]|uniref:hypothetical protein n=1 Tax=Amycolatopsis sp. CA-230715 TaxID=2745196 RepID=UPI001C011B15|nr:hypothetical protein [Amycolatopsis sp. CA-230715]
MGWLDFISAILGHIAWPALLLFLILYFRKPLLGISTSLLETLTSREISKFELGAGGVKFEFGETLRDTEKKIEDIKKETHAEVEELDEKNRFIDEMKRLAVISPEAAILDAWSRLEAKLNESYRLRTRGAEPPPGNYPFIAARTLLPSSEFAVLKNLNDMRGSIAHRRDDQTVSESEAVRYAEMVFQVAVSITLAHGKTTLDGPVI